MANAHFGDTLTDLVRKLTHLNWLSVFTVTFCATLFLELLFKSSIISSIGMVFDDLFYFERATHGLSFNSVNPAPGESITNHGSDYTPNLKAYRFLVTWLGDISSVRMFHLIVLSVNAGLLALIIRPFFNDTVLTIGVATFAHVTPFSHILITFANGTYFALFFFFFFSSILFFRRVNFSEPVPRSNWFFLATGAFLATVGARTVDSGILLLIPLFVYFVLQSRALETTKGRTTTAFMGVALLVLIFLTVASIEHPYASMPGRLDYSIPSMIERGFYILSQITQHYFQPKLYTGVRLTAGNLVPVTAFFGIMSCIILGTLFVQRRALLEKARKNPNLPLFALFALGLGASIAPYAAQSITHIWHYFPHMIFFVVLVFAVVQFLLGRTSATALLLIVVVLTIRNYATTTLELEKALDRQSVLADFVVENSSDLAGASHIIVTSESTEALTGLIGPIRFTAFLRNHLDQPYLSEVLVANGMDQAREFYNERGEHDTFVILEIPIDFNETKLHATEPEFSAPVCAAGVPIVNWPESNRVNFDSYTWNADRLDWHVETDQTFMANGSNRKLFHPKFFEGTLVRMTISMSPHDPIVEEQPYSATFPPMPVRSAALNVYHRSDGFHITSTNAVTSVAKATSESTVATIIGVEGCYYNLLLADGRWQPLAETEMSGPWAVGRGIGDRFWTGEIDWKVEIIANATK